MKETFGLWGHWLASLERAAVLQKIYKQQINEQTESDREKYWLLTYLVFSIPLSREHACTHYSLHTLMRDSQIRMLKGI